MTAIPCFSPAAIIPGISGAVAQPLRPNRAGMRPACSERGREAAHAGGFDPDLWLYRERTIGMLRRYQRLSVEVGRLPSLLGREFFRTQVTSYQTGTFEDAVIFVHDVARGLEQLGDFERKLISKIALQDYTQNEAARLLGCWRRTVGWRFPEAVDQLTEIFLEAGLLNPLPGSDVARAENCQEGKIEEIPASASEQRK
jgi:hypothetical protein